MDIRHLLCALMLSLACTPPPLADTPDSRLSAIAALRQADERFQQAIAERDLDLVVASYSPEATLMPVAEPAISGSSAIRQEWEHLFAIPDFKNSAQLVTAEVAESGELGYTRGTYTTTLAVGEGKTEVEYGKWVTIWKRRPGVDWKIVVDIYNTDAPPPDHL